MVANFSDRVASYQDRVNTVLEQHLVGSVPARLFEAMRYTTLGGGKRIRPLLVYAAGEVLGIAPLKLDSLACAIELIHTYSLVHDDLPAMDDDDLRRGQPTVHKAYDEAMAILVGDALQALAFQIVASDQHLNDSTKVRAIEWLGRAAGAVGMVGGQVMDMAFEQQQVTQLALENMFALKTGELIRASIVMPCFALEPFDKSVLEHLDQFSQNIGLAFQIHDDVLDVESSTELLGKPQGSDEENEKATYPSLFGLDVAKQRANELYTHAMESLATFGDKAEPLRWLSDYIIARSH